ncbi:uncharacterized protein LOC143284693 [Babylonia areolata]|uniref:uncharacterized protein LOC143284693 n=1 Tax=Babylonia areolata TaxID=304850 RepID=UPI003FD4307E
MSRGRGRGRGRGAGFRGRGRGRRPGNRGASQPRANDSQQAGEVAAVVDIDTRPKDFFVGVVPTAEHMKAQEKNRPRYAAALAVLQKNGVAIAQNSRVRALAMAWARNDYELADALLNNRSQFGLPEVLKAIQLLDSGRQVRVLEKKLKKLQLSGAKVNPKKMGKLKSDIDNTTALKPPIGSASGAVCKHVARWVQGFTKEELEFYALHLPKEPWKKLADICHFHPENDFAALPWFLPFCFGKDAPEGTMVNRCRELTRENLNSLLVEYDIPYSHVKQMNDTLTQESKQRIAEYEEKLDTVLWYYEELQCKAVDDVIERRLAAKEVVTLPSGKLLERLLTFKMIHDGIDGRSNQASGSSDKACFLPNLISLAEPRLTSIKLPLEAPIVVIGDKSGSMGVAIRTSTIIASLLTAITAARLVFFNNSNHEAEFMPETVEQVLQLAVTTHAEGGTAPAVSLWPFYERKEVVKTFIMVTDEEENSNSHGFSFAELYKKYCDEVYPARLVFVSFLRHQHAIGQMVRELQGMGFSPLQFCLEGSRPDLSKLDNLFGLLSADSATFDEELAATERRIREEGLGLVYKALKSRLKEDSKD